MNSLTGTLAQELVALRFDDLPGAVPGRAMSLIEDTVLVAAAGATNTRSHAFAKVFAAAGGAPEASAWGGTHSRLPRMQAAFVNALHASTLDYDSLNGAVHADAVCLPAAWAVAEASAASGRDLICAFVAGSEITARLSRAREGPQKGWSGTSLYGALGAAAAAGKLLRLPPGQMAHALGLAAIQGAGTQQSNVERVLSKRLQPAFAARNGVTAALLAAAGATAPKHVFEGAFGLHALYEAGNGQAVLNDLWTRFDFAETAIKSYPVCACSHAAMVACERLLRLHRMPGATFVDELARITVTITPFMARLVGAPFTTDGDLEVTAQFSIQYALAVLVVHGCFGLAALAPQQVRDPVLGALIERIQVVVDPSHTGELAPATVEMRMRDGTRWTARCDVCPGGPTTPADPGVRQSKRVDCALAAGWDADTLQRFVDEVADLPSLDRSGDFWENRRRRQASRSPARS